MARSIFPGSPFAARRVKKNPAGGMPSGVFLWATMSRAAPGVSSRAPSISSRDASGLLAHGRPEACGAGRGAARHYWPGPITEGFSESAWPMRAAASVA